MIKFTHNLVSIAALSAVTLLGHVGSAQAFTFNMTRGINGPGGATNQGAFSDYFGNSNVKTIDFNDGKLPIVGFATYTFQFPNLTTAVTATGFSRTPGSGFRAEGKGYGPLGPNGEINNSWYPKVSRGNSLTINLTSTANYFGMDWGAISRGNTISFYRGNQLIKDYNTANANAEAGKIVAPVIGGPKNERNGYGNFYADNVNERFDRIVLSQLDSTAFETDNHSFHVGERDVRKTPEPGMMLGLVAIGGSVWAKRKQRG